MNFDEIVRAMEKQVRSVGREAVETMKALGRISARDVFSRKDMPPFDVSALDGYAVKGAGRDFRVKGTAEPMSSGRTRLRKGEALFVSTGAPFPPDTRFVAREHVTERQGRIETGTETDERKVVTKGAWLKKGERLTGRGEAVTPPAMALLALAGHRSLQVFKKPAVSIVTTGSELKKGRMIDSNRFLLAGLAQRDGGEVTRVETADDREEDIRETITGMSSADLLILTGGTSKGKKDLTKEALRNAGGRFYVESPSILPGKTMAFGKRGRTCFFVLPGNPQALQTLYELFVKRILFLLSGRGRQEDRTYRLPLPRDVEKPPNMTEILPVRLRFAPVAIEEMYPENPDAFAVLAEGSSLVLAGREVEVLLP